MSIVIKDSTSGNELSVDANGNAGVALRDHNGNPITIAEGQPVSSDLATPQQYLVQGVENDGIIVPMRGDRHGSVGIASVVPMLQESSLAASVNATRWVQSTSTMTITQAIATGITLNAGANAAINTYAIATSGKTFPRTPRQPLEWRCRARVSAIVNSVVELGFGNPTTNTAQIPTGAFFRANGPSNIRPVVAFNGSDVVTGDPYDMTLYVGAYLLFTVVIDDNVAMFCITDVSTGEVLNRQLLKIPSSSAKVQSIASIPCFGRVYNSAVAPASAPLLVMSEVAVGALDNAMQVPASLAAALNFEDGATLPATGLISTTFANSAAPANATLSNTAAGYSTLGGLFSFVAVAGAATDYALFNYVPTRDFVCTGFHAEAWNTGAAVATSPTTLVWGIGHDGATVNLSTGAHRRQAVGMQSFPVGAAIGAGADRSIDVSLEPVVTRAGRSLTIILRMPSGAATASQVVQGLVNVKGYHL